MSVNITVSQTGTQGNPGTSASTSSSISSASQIILWEDFLSNTAAGNTGATSSTISGGTATILTAESNYMGMCRLSTGASSASAYSNLFWGSANIFLGNGILTLESLIRISTLSTSAERYIVRIGLHDSVNGEATNGVYLKYDESTSANWIICSYASSVGTETTSSTAVSGNTWIKVKIVVNAAASSVEYFINGTSIGTITTNIPTSPSGIRLHILKSVGTTARVLDIDFVSLNYGLTISR